MNKLLMSTIAVSALLTAACDPGEDIEEPIVGTEVVETDVEPVGYTWDTNQDSLFQEAEYTGWNQQGITTWDADSDNRLDQQEFSTGWTQAGFNNPDGVFTDWDDDNDGFLNADEWFGDDEWDEWDTNTDGVLQNDEFGYY